MNLDNIPTDALIAAARGNQVPASRSSAPTNGTMKGLGDYQQPFHNRVNPARSMPMPAGPADFPVQQLPIAPQFSPGVEGKLDQLAYLLRQMIALNVRILEELIRQNIAALPVIRASDITATGQTLDWSELGSFDRLMMINLGTDDVWFTFDQNGPSVKPVTQDNSFKLTASMSINLTHSQFRKIGAICAAGKTATLQAIAWQTVAGNQAGAID